MTYSALASFAQTWGMLYMIAIFAVACAYALWPSNKRTFQRAADLPLDEGDRP